MSSTPPAERSARLGPEHNLPATVQGRGSDPLATPINLLTTTDYT